MELESFLARGNSIRIGSDLDVGAEARAAIASAVTDMTFGRSLERAAGRTHHDVSSVVQNSRRQLRLASGENSQLFASLVAAGASVFGMSTFVNPGTGTAPERARLYQVCAPSHCRPP